MADYFDNGAAAPAADAGAAPANGAAPASGGDVGMDDEIMVRTLPQTIKIMKY